MIVMKFGGSSIGSGERMLHVARLICQIRKTDDIVVVVSAIYKITDKLISIFEMYKFGDLEVALTEMKKLYELHIHILENLELSDERYNEVEKEIQDLFGDLSLYLTLHREYTIADYDYVISFGERLSSYLLAAALRTVGIEAEAVSASSVIIANSEFTNARVLIKETKIQAEKTLNPLLSKKILPVVTGFFGNTKDGKIVTLGRGGSDYSATILANVLDAKEVILWKEVDGVFSNDPKKDTHARFYPELSYEEAHTLAKNGAKVLHPETMEPVALKDIILRVKNTFNPDFIGTKIWKGVSA
jgi:aspartate kinase